MFLRQSDPERLTARIVGSSRTAVCRMETYRDGETFHIDIDMPGVDPAGIDVAVDGATMTVRAHRAPAPHAGQTPLPTVRAVAGPPADQVGLSTARDDAGPRAGRVGLSTARDDAGPPAVATEIPLSRALDTDRLAARYDDGVLTISIPIRADGNGDLSRAA